jgi:hypothetical protein
MFYPLKSVAVPGDRFEVSKMSVRGKLKTQLDGL